MRAAPDAAEWRGTVVLSGKAKIGEAEVTREARSASIVWGKRVFGNQAQVRSRLDLETVLSVVSENEPRPRRPEGEQGLDRAGRRYPRVSDQDHRERHAHGQPRDQRARISGLRTPPTVSINEGQTEGVLKFDFKPTGAFALVPGRYQFVPPGGGQREVPAQSRRGRGGETGGRTDQGDETRPRRRRREGEVHPDRRRQGARRREAARSLRRRRCGPRHAEGRNGPPRRPRADVAKKAAQEAEAKLAAQAKAEAAATQAVTAAETRTKERSHLRDLFDAHHRRGDRGAEEVRGASIKPARGDRENPREVEIAARGDEG